MKENENVGPHEEAVEMALANFTEIPVDDDGKWLMTHGFCPENREQDSWVNIAVYEKEPGEIKNPEVMTRLKRVWKEGNGTAWKWKAHQTVVDDDGTDDSEGPEKDTPFDAVVALYEKLCRIPPADRGEEA